MKLSDTTKDFERIEETEHVQKIIEELHSKVPHYFNLINHSKGITKDSKPLLKLVTWTALFNDGIKKYEKECSKYRDFFSEDNMEEFEEIDDPKAFKSELRKDCPIIRKSLMSKMEELQSWKEDFARAKPIELFETFANFLDFQNEYVEQNDKKDYDSLISYKDFHSLHQFSDDEDLILRNVIGAGIKTTIIYNLNPQFFCKSVRRTLYGLYFLTENVHNIAPSRTSEFIMVDDNPRNSARGSKFNFRMEHNYWYPYNLFMLYTNQIFITLNSLLNNIGVSLNDKYRFVYVNIFLEQICVLKNEAVQTMMGGDQDF